MKSSLARSSAATASYSFFLSACRARTVALGGGGGWEPGAWEARVDVVDGRMGVRAPVLYCADWRA